MGGAADAHLALLHRLEQRDCTFAGARLISSASTKLPKTGPCWTWNVPVLRAVDLACRRDPPAPGPA